MDPITAINHEFARLVEQDWSRAAAERSSEHATRAPRAHAAKRLLALVGIGSKTFGRWLKAQERRIGRAIAQRRAQLGR